MLSTDPLTLAVDDGGDLDISGGTVRFASGAAGVKALVAARLDLRRGEFFGSRRSGLPLYEGTFVDAQEALLGQDFDAVKARAAYSAQILSAPAVASLRTLDVEYRSATRTLEVAWEARAVFDDTAIAVGS